MLLPEAVKVWTLGHSRMAVSRRSAGIRSMTTWRLVRCHRLFGGAQLQFESSRFLTERERLHWLKLRRFDVPASRAGVGVEDLVSHRPVSDRTLLAEGAGKVYILEINTSIYIHNHCGYRGADADEGLRRRLHHGSRGGFMGCSGDCVALRAQLNAVHFPATIDNGNLQTAEYIKFTAGFFNLEAAANQFFDATVAAYTANAGQSNGPKVAWIEYNSRGALPSYRVSMAAYRAQMVDAEAGRIVNGNDLLAQGMAVRDIVASNPAAGKVCILEINASEATAATVAQTLTKALHRLLLHGSRTGVGCAERRRHRGW